MTNHKGRHGGKMKAWRLGATVKARGAVLPEGAAGKAALTVMGGALRDNPGLLRHVHRVLSRERQRLGPAGYTVAHAGDDYSWVLERERWEMRGPNEPFMALSRRDAE
jgi:hypothetical protein